MKNIFHFAAYFIYLFGLLLLLVLQANKYDWMKDFDPSISVPKDPSGDSAVFATLLLIVMIMTQIYVVIKAKKTWIKILSGALILLALIVWIVRFVL